MANQITDKELSRDTLVKLYELLCQYLIDNGTDLETDENGMIKLRMEDYGLITREMHGTSEGALKVRELVENNGYTAEACDFGWWFYRKINGLKSMAPGKVIKVRDIWYRESYAIFLGYDNLDDFEKKNKTGKYAPQIVNQDQPATAQQEPGPQLQYYIGVYYSIKNYRIKKFFLTIDFNPKPDGSFSATQWGFHVEEDDNMHQDNFKIPEQVNSIPFAGSATRMANHLYVNLFFKGTANMPNPMQMNIVGMVDHWRADKDIIVCSLQTVSLKGYAVVVEAILLKSTAQNVALLKNPATFFNTDIPGVSPEANQYLALYLMLQRRNFWVRNEVPPSLEELQVRNVPVKSYAEQIVSKWRIWNFNPGSEGGVVQSLLEIESPVYASFLHPYIHKDHPNIHSLKKQAAVITISADKMYFASYAIGRGSHLRLVQNAIFDIRNIGRGYAEGAFISGAGTHLDQHSLVGGYCVMSRITDYDPVRDKPQFFTKMAAEDLAEKLGLTPMYEALHLLWKKKHDRYQTRTGHVAIWFDSEKGFCLVKRESGMFKGQLEFPGGKVAFGKSPIEWLETKFREQTGKEASFEPMRGGVVSKKYLYTFAGQAIQFHSIGILYEAKLKDPGNPLNETSDTTETMEAGKTDPDATKPTEHDADEIPTESSSGSVREIYWRKPSEIRAGEELTPLAEEIIHHLKIYAFVTQTNKDADPKGSKPPTDGAEIMD